MKPTPVFLPEKSHGRRSLVVCSPCGCEESDTIEQLSIGCFHVLVIVNSAAVNVGVHASFQVSFIWVYVKEWDCWIIWKLCFEFFQDTPCCFP